ncbi:hypothetical protein EFO90_11500 [Lactiplantibacillus plantarum]|uniref:hypothetical protein n=1 Tax=Lactiplantibacillus plantarum TaxID=1590 RepID=UPI0021825205|nr:hypothetical protein [Lactiplantibacillus plantarum]MCS8620223.1 hypothetical protein [Lactiplantibacillus plantarum]MCT3214961.1 hypothetical protein [Lactiplantibacillus plantarum]MCT3272011.1 hypothetical protein [Lactiplantibacillus plantarum]
MAELITDALPLPLGRGFREDLVLNFKIIKDQLNELDVDTSAIDELKKKFDDISGEINDYEANIQAIVNILSDYDVPIAIVDGKVTRTEEGE